MRVGNHRSKSYKRNTDHELNHAYTRHYEFVIGLWQLATCWSCHWDRLQPLHQFSNALLRCPSLNAAWPWQWGICPQALYMRHHYLFGLSSTLSFDTSLWHTLYFFWHFIVWHTPPLLSKPSCWGKSPWRFILWIWWFFPWGEVIIFDWGEVLGCLDFFSNLILWNDCVTLCTVQVVPNI